MKELVSFELATGEAIIVEIDDRDPGFERAARDGEIAKAATRLESALDVVRPTADAIAHRLRALSVPADEIRVDFGVRLNARAGAVIASTEGQGHFQVTLTWRREAAAG